MHTSINNRVSNKSAANADPELDKLRNVYKTTKESFHHDKYDASVRDFGPDQQRNMRYVIENQSPGNLETDVRWSQIMNSLQK